MEFAYLVRASLERDSGPFESREAIGGQIEEALQSADYGDWSGDNDGTYSTVEWDIEEHFDPKLPSAKALAAAVEQLDAKRQTQPVAKLLRPLLQQAEGSSIGLAPSYSCANGHYFNEDGEPHSAPQTITIDKRWPRV